MFLGNPGLLRPGVTLSSGSFTLSVPGALAPFTPFVHSPMARSVTSLCRCVKATFKLISTGRDREPVLMSSVMPKLKAVIDGNTTAIVFNAGELDPGEWNETVKHITGEYRWWYGEVSPGIDAYVITVEDADGNIANPDWKELPVLLRDELVAGVRGTLPTGADS